MSVLSFSVIEDTISARSLAVQAGQESGAALVNFSVFSLHMDVQNTFSILLLIPVGALVVVGLRNLVRLQTSGTFMQILIALVFVQTQLVTGLILFVTLVGVGLDIATGRSMRTVQHDRPVIHPPDTGADLSEIVVPNWSELPHLPARCQAASGLGYLGVDVVLDRTAGPLVPKLNARPGLAIQIANGVGMLPGIEAVDAVLKEWTGRA